MPKETSTIWMADKVLQMPITSLNPYARSTRIHTQSSIARLKVSIEQFGFVIPILVTSEGEVIAGHGRLEAAKLLGMSHVPVIIADHLSEDQVRALRIADNKLAELSDWNEEALRIELGDLMELNLAGELEFDMEVMGFDLPEIDIILGGAEEPTEDVETFAASDPNQLVVTQSGDIWCLGDHRIVCANALEAASFEAVLQGDVPQLVFTDPPYNVMVNGHVRSGSAGHSEFAMASGEMTDQEFCAFLEGFAKHLLARLPEGGIAMACIDWRHIDALITVGKAVGFEFLNLCVWNKTNGGMGSLYRSKHELVAVFKKPGAAHINNVQLGKHGRNRTNVWDYAGVNTFGAGRDADLADHPTVKPTQLVADAIMDVTHRGDAVLDCFGGSGATLLAAEKVGRKAWLIELEPRYVDVTIRRWQEMTGKAAVHVSTAKTFGEREADASEKEMANV